jgi:hypothetical protein
MHEQEKRIKDQRTIEANRKKLMGLEGKLGCIVKNLGQPIVRQDEGDFFHDANYLDTDLEEPEGDIIDQLPTIDYGDMVSEEAYRSERIAYNIQEIGMHFDGLSKGIHMEIRYMEETGELLATYKGHVVYKELAGELESYVPFSEWEDKINLLFPLARTVEIQKTGQVKDLIKKDRESKRVSLLEKIRKRWGV